MPKTQTATPTTATPNAAAMPAASRGSIAHPTDVSSYEQLLHGWKKNKTDVAAPTSAAAAPMKVISFDARRVMAPT
ncbi:hypothetical protein [Pseudoclavibacter helvolus]|uniref:hypothetical protein n=1 Tax=Pseudoclavibacter helvolus TaxID=255205 RepID=UPI003C710BC5